MIASKQIQRPKLVLVVDDHEINRDALGIILEDDYQVLYVDFRRESVFQEDRFLRQSLAGLSLIDHLIDCGDLRIRQLVGISGKIRIGYGRQL